MFGFFFIHIDPTPSPPLINDWFLLPSIHKATYLQMIEHLFVIYNDYQIQLFIYIWCKSNIYKIASVIYISQWTLTCRDIYLSIVGGSAVVAQPTTETHIKLASFSHSVYTYYTCTITVLYMHNYSTIHAQLQYCTCTITVLYIHNYSTVHTQLQYNTCTITVLYIHNYSTVHAQLLYIYNWPIYIFTVLYVHNILIW